jgi:hypothetical protein
MLVYVFLVCAVVGGTVLVLQFLLLLIGLGGQALDIDVPHDIGHDFGGDFSADFHGDVGADFHGDAGGDFHGDAGGDFHGDAGGDVAQGGHATGDHHMGSSWLFGVISFRTVVAALALFGLGGLAADAAEMGQFAQLIVGALAGLAAMYGVYFMVLSLGKLKAEGTPRIERAVGQHGTVYVTIPAEDSGAGKIQLNLQNRTMEYLAQTSGHVLPPGAKVVVTDVITSDTVEVEPVLENEERNGHA